MLIRTVTKFEAAHRQLGDPGKCGYLHGHNWTVEWEICGEPNDLGYVVDFKDLKEISNKFDHTVILKANDPLVEILTRADQRVISIVDNPTCENIARHLANVTINKFDNLYSVFVRVYENDVSYSEDEICL